MLFLLSPAKALDYETPLPPDVPHTEALFKQPAAELIGVLRQKSPQQIAQLMHLSDALAGLNAARYEAFSPRFTVQVFSQWLASNRAFREPQVYVDDRSLAPVDYAGERAFSTRTWALNLITRWEYRPGSTFFLVYTHGAETDALVNDRASLSPRRDLALMNRLPSDDGVQVKLSYLFR